MLFCHASFPIQVDFVVHFVVVLFILFFWGVGGVAKQHLFTFVCQAKVLRALLCHLIAFFTCYSVCENKKKPYYETCFE